MWHCGGWDDKERKKIVSEKTFSSKHKSHIFAARFEKTLITTLTNKSNTIIQP
jgi:hypothetical protein